jgi:hypothetical protein
MGNPNCVVRNPPPVPPPAWFPWNVPWTSCRSDVQKTPPPSPDCAVFPPNPQLMTVSEPDRGEASPPPSVPAAF